MRGVPCLCYYGAGVGFVDSAREENKALTPLPKRAQWLKFSVILRNGDDTPGLHPFDTTKTKIDTTKTKSNMELIIETETRPTPTPPLFFTDVSKLKCSCDTPSLRCEVQLSSSTKLCQGARYQRYQATHPRAVMNSWHCTITFPT